MTIGPDQSGSDDDVEGLDHPEVASAPRSVAKNIAALMSSQVVTWTLSIVLAWIVPRFLGAQAFGSLQVATALWMIAAVFAEFGTATLLTVEIARRRDTFSSLLANSIRLRFAIGAVVAPIVIAILVFGPYDAQTREVAIIVGVGAGVTLCANAMESALFGLQEMGYPSRIRVISKIFVTVATIAVLLRGGRLLSVAAVSFGGVILGAVLLFGAVKRHGVESTATSRLRGSGLLIASVPFFAAAATRVIYLQIDTVVMSVLVDSTTIGYYAAADLLFGSLLFVPVIVLTAMFPAIAELHERAPTEVPALLGRTFNTLLVVSVPIGLGTIVVAPSFVDLLYGEGYKDTAPVLAVYGVVVILASQTILLGRFALATGRASFWSSLMIGVTILSIPLDIVLVRWTDQRFENGAIGGALAYVVTEALLIMVGLFVIGRGVVASSLKKRLLRCLVAGAAMLLTSWSFRDEFFAIPGAIAVVTYACVIIVLRTLEPHELMLLRNLQDKIPLRRGSTSSQ